MKAMNISLPTGPFDWSDALIPRAEIAQRLKLARGAMRETGVAQLLVHGDGADHGALTWLTGFTPKLGAAFALIPLDGEPALIFTGGPGMKPSAQKLTWVTEVNSVRDFAGDLAALIAARGGGVVGLCEGAGMADAAYAAVTRASGPPPRDLTDAIDMMRRAKSPTEIGFIEQAAAAVDAARRALETELPRGRRAALVAAEREAIHAGAQDARIMSATRANGAPRPLDDNDPVICGPVPVAIAARVRGYWASLETVMNAPADLAHEAKELLASLVNDLAPGLPPGLPEGARSRWALHIHGVGLSLEESCPNHEVSAGEVICLQMQFSVASQGSFAWSALAHVEGKRARLILTA